MLGNLSKAKSICTTAEWQLLYQSTEKRIEVLSESRLRSKIARARKLRNKYRDLAHAQKRQTRGKGRTRGKRKVINNANTVRKQELFAAALKRLENRLQQLVKEEKAKAAATKKKSRSKSETVAGQSMDRADGSSSSTSGVKKVVRKPSVVVALASASRSGKPLRQKAERTRGMRSIGRQVNANFTKIHAHVSARGRRNQAKRDSK